MLRQLKFIFGVLLAAASVGCSKQTFHVSYDRVVAELKTLYPAPDSLTPEQQRAIPAYFGDRGSGPGAVTVDYTESRPGALFHIDIVVKRKFLLRRSVITVKAVDPGRTHIAVASHRSSFWPVTWWGLDPVYERQRHDEIRKHLAKLKGQ